ncbi:MAG TPA: ATP-binding protein [Pseudacidobacterium sp.]|nr:ATP-binding protein [Pseudacidobacterium sp.]
MKPYSITRRLIVTVLLVELIAALCVTGMAWFYERHSHFRAFDIMLRGRADSLLGSVEDADDAEDNVMLDMKDLAVPREDIYEVRDEKGHLLGRSPNWEGASAQMLTSQQDRMFPLRLHGRSYRVLLRHGLRIVDPNDASGGVPHHVTVVYGSPTKHVWHAVIDTVQFYAISSLALLAVTGAVMAWLLNRSLAPLHELAAEASTVSVNSWKFTPSERACATKELFPLVQALEAALQRLERSFMQQRRFVSDSAHELKTGVAVVKSSLQLLGMKPRSAEEYQAGLARCEADCERMEEIVAKMLTLARVDASAETHAPSVTDVGQALQQVQEQLQPIADTRGITITRIVPEALSAHLAPQECSLLFSNLLLNALQHSVSGTTVSIQGHACNGYAEIQITDQGDGIPPEALPHVFEPFYRGDASRNRNTGGTGLGLSICKAIVDKAGGDIRITSQPGKGTTVTVQLPGLHETSES